MNVLELLNSELKDKDWSLDSKARYIYLRSCELFSYDPRFKFCTFLENSKQVEKQIMHNYIDLENLQDNLVVCTSHTISVLSEMLRTLLNVEVGIKGNGHLWTIFNDGKRNIESDATISSDLSRVKMGLSTRGYNTSTRDYSFLEQLKNIDINIDYIKKDYQNYFLDRRMDGLFSEFLKDNDNKLIHQDTDDYYIYKLYTLKEIFDSYKSLNGFSDSEFCISYLGYKYFKDDNININAISLFDLYDDTEWEFVNIYPIKLRDNILYFILEKTYNGYSFHEITELDAIHHVKELRGTNKEVLTKIIR